MPSYDQELFATRGYGDVVEKRKLKPSKLAMILPTAWGVSVFTSNFRTCLCAIRRIRNTGMMFINQPTNSRLKLSFGGIKQEFRIWAGTFETRNSEFVQTRKLYPTSARKPNSRHTVHAFSIGATKAYAIAHFKRYKRKAGRKSFVLDSVTRCTDYNEIPWESQTQFRHPSINVVTEFRVHPS